MHALLATIGSLGDLHPVLGLGMELRARGHSVTIATSESHRSIVEAAAFSFAPIRPNLSLDPGRTRELFDQRRGRERLIRDFVMPIVRELFEDLLPFVQNAEIFVASELIYPAAAISEKCSIPWLSLIMAPASFFSIYDPPVLPPVSFLHELRRLGRWTYLVFNGLFRLATSSWSRPLRRLRLELGLSRGLNPIFDAKHSPYGSLAVFPPYLGRPQSDWPKSAIQTGFIFYDGTHQKSESLRRFLDGGEPPVVFTLGSAAVRAAGDFYQVAFEAVQKIGRRAIFLLGDNVAPRTSSADFYFAKYLPFSLVFPHAAAVVHQGGIGTCVPTLRAGCPSLVIPFGPDKLRNTYRMRRLGVARSLPLARLGVNAMIRELRTLLLSSDYKMKAFETSREIVRERGAQIAATAIERAHEAGHCPK